MPVINTNIPEEMLNIIRDLDFLKTFKKEYIEVFDEKRINGNCTICNRVTYFTAETVGWCKALKNTCKLTNNINLYEYYMDLDLYIMEKFDNILIELLENNYLFLKNYQSSLCETCFLDE